MAGSMVIRDLSPMEFIQNRSFGWIQRWALLAV
jgi:hypothetical protein